MDNQLLCDLMMGGGEVA